MHTTTLCLSHEEVQIDGEVKYRLTWINQTTFIYTKQGLANYSPQAESSLLPVFVGSTR